MIKKTLALLLILSILFSFSGCFGKVEAGELKLELNSTPTSLDPLLAESDTEKQIVFALFEGLMRYADGQLQCASAEEYTTSDDGLTYTFTLRKNLKWSDGEDLTASDFVFGLQRAVTPETQSPYAYKLFDIVNAEEANNGECNPTEIGVKATDSRTLVITIKQPNKNFILNLSSLASMPCRKDFFESCGGRYGLDKKYVISNGAYKLTGWVDEYTDREVTMYQNAKYNGVFEASLSSIDITFEKKSERIDRLSKSLINTTIASETEVSGYTEAGYNAFTFQKNCYSLLINSKNSVLSDLELRQALAKCIDREALNSVTPELYSTAYDFIPTSCYVGYTQYRTENNNTIVSYDIASANEIFNNYISKHKTVIPTMEIIYSDAELLTAISQFAQEWQKQFGIYVIPKEVTASELKTAVNNGNYDMAVYGFTSTDGTVYSMLNNFLPNSNTPFSSFGNDEYKELFSQAANEQDDTNAVTLFRNCEEYLLSQANVVPLYFTSEGYIYNSDVLGISLYPNTTVLDLCRTTAKHEK